MKFDVLIVGAGLAGAALAAALRGSTLKIGIVEARPPSRPAGWDPRIYAISPTNADFLSAIGIWQHLDPTRMAPVYDMEIHGDAGGRLDFSAYDSGLRELAWILESSLMQQELWETVKRQHNVTLICPASPAALSIDDAAARLTLTDGRRIEARLVVAADGRDSWVRQAAGIGARNTPYDEKGVVANFRCEKAHRNTAFQWFRPDGVLAYLPLPEQHMSMVWSAPDAIADELVALSPEALCAKVAAAGGHRLGALELVTPAAAFPLRLMRVDTAVQARLALIGDAAHAIHPLSGHGINLGYQDARVLAEQLAALPAWRDPGELPVLRAYARARAEETALLQYTTHGLNRLFKPADPLLSGLRNLGLNLTNKLPVLRNALVRYAIAGRF
ncbi:MAG TPA: UbiH/UbiF family hydroxylase [Zoogloea sp.]|jgi:ubiquinone biosynthesis UbiH/UbiF/VisC/COQ6 family hydroxylase|uniref:UbiH/UbiF family hydroxylase n=1 Tax=Zoogloea sp. TaxID=49181 RepID=UPI002C3D4CD1|nr:UbiH/UbiF family hydroxylase [Zoogloea sp.]HOB45175.1 UbiH/UbiF family hydroxylase [Zoogloea sp.]HQA11371.1 UbiH/UbiF family hydroxylase [Zoogloea sp.]HQE39940.1 UbiH/UbiF family hydroxylase [Zoogloea sp.]